MKQRRVCREVDGFTILGLCPFPGLLFHYSNDIAHTSFEFHKMHSYVITGVYV